MTNTELREKLVELFNNHYDCCDIPDCEGNCRECIADYLIANGVTFADCLEQKQATSDMKTSDTKWISTVEYLPLPNIPVVVVREDTNEKQYLSVEMFETNDGEHWFWSNDDVSWRFIVTHWMPLPSLPKGE